MAIRPSDARKAIRERGHLILTNPDMLHSGILPHHTKWMRLFENLRYIVLDELHTYRGVFGSHLANVLRRLARIASFTAPSHSSSAARRPLRIRANWHRSSIEKNVETIEENGAPAGEKFFVFYNPPMVNRNLGIRRSYLNETTRVAQELLARKLQTIVFANSADCIPKCCSLICSRQIRTDRPTGTDSRISRRLFAKRTARNRTRAARRRNSRSGRDERAGTGN